MDTNMFEKIERLLNGRHLPSYELEVRFGSFSNNRFNSSVDPRAFYRLVEHFSRNSEFEYVATELSIQTGEKTGNEQPHFPDVIYENIYDSQEAPEQDCRGYSKFREQWVPQETAGTDVYFYNSKRSCDKVDLPNYFVRISLAKEADFGTNKPANMGQEIQAQRQKRRWSFAIKSGSNTLKKFRIDLTHVNGWSLNRNGQRVNLNSFEVELELISDNVNVQRELKPAILQMLSLLQNTKKYMTADEMRNVNVAFNNLFKSDIRNLETKMQQTNPRWKFFIEQNIYQAVNRPENIKIKNLLDANELAVTDKADGERKLLFITGRKMYLMYPKNVAIMYDELNTNKYNGTLIDGEYLIDNKASYLAFDLLFSRGTDFRGKPFTERLKELTQIATGLKIEIKKFYLSDNFYKRTAKALEEISKKPYGNDGLIFNKMNSTYFDKVFKWKPPEKMTIDFKLEDGPNPSYFILTVTDKHMSVQFIGTKRHPVLGMFNASKYDANFQAGQVWEMSWDGTEFKPFRPRPDRDQPNALHVAQSVWNDICEPITEETILGKTLVVMRKYHNVIKRNMINRYCRVTGKVLDIGAGRGGDISKWEQVKAKVLSVEPNQENMDEMIRRLRSEKYREYSVAMQTNVASMQQFEKDETKFTMLNTVGQDTDTIVAAFQQIYGDKAQCISLFNALTFFYDQEKSLNALVETISNLLEIDGYFIGMVMDGQIVRRMFSKSGQLKEIISALPKGEYYNIDNKKTITNPGNNYHKSQKYHIVSTNQKHLKQVVELLNSPDRTVLKKPGWTITRKGKFTNSPFGNEIEIHLKDTIVTNQTEYLVDFDVLQEKLWQHGIILEESGSYFLSNNNLSASQERLNSFYRTFVFKRISEGFSGEPSTGPSTEEESVESPVKQTVKAPAKEKRKISQGSEQIIIEHAENTTVQFKTLGNPELLGPDQYATYRLQNMYDFIRIGVLTQNPLLAAFLRAADPKYPGRKKVDQPELKKKEIAAQEKYLRKEQDEIIKKMKTYYQQGQLPELSKFNDTWTKASKVLKNGLNWGLLDLYPALTNIFNVNLILIVQDSPYEPQLISKVSLPNDPGRTIQLFHHDGTFEVLASQDDSPTQDKLITMFTD